MAKTKHYECPSGSQRGSAFRTEAGRLVGNLIGCGFRLCIPRDAKRHPGAMLILLGVGPLPRPTMAAVGVEQSTVDDLLSAGLLGELPEHRTSAKMGWRECGYPGDDFRVYAFIQ